MPVTRFLVRSPAGAGRHHGPPRAPATRSRSSSASSTPTASTSPRTPSARSSGCSTGRTSAGCCPAEIGDIGFPPRALEHYTAALEEHRRHRRRSRGAGFKVVVDYALRLDVVRHAERARQARRRRARRQPLRLDRRRCSASTATPHAERRRRPRAGLGRPPRRGASTPTASTSRSSTTTGHVLTDDRGAAGAASTLVSRPPARRPGRAAGQRQPRTPSDLAAAHGVERRVHEDVDAGADGRGRRAGRRLRRQPATAASSSRASCRLRRRRHARQAARAARPHDGARCRGASTGCPRCTWPTRRS